MSVVADSSKPAAMVIAANPMDKSSATIAAMPKTSTITALSNQPVVKLVKLSASTITSSCDTTNNQEQIVEKAKQVIIIILNIFNMSTLDYEKVVQICYIWSDMLSREIDTVFKC